MFEWEDIGTKTETEFVLKCIFEKIWNKTIIKVFDLYGDIFDWNKKENSYVCTDDDVYIMFEDNTCFYCGCKLSRSAHVDHVIPWAFVKADHLWNFVLACPKYSLKSLYRSDCCSIHRVANVARNA